MLGFSTFTAFDNFGKNVIADFRAAQKAKGKRATGKSADNMYYQATATSVRVIDKEGYIYFQEYGRGPGKPPPISKIKEWLEAKKLTHLNPFAVRNIIAKNGTLLWRKQAQSVGLADIIKERTAELKKELQLYMLVDIKQSIIKNLA